MACRPGAAGREPALHQRAGPDEQPPRARSTTPSVNYLQYYLGTPVTDRDRRAPQLRAPLQLRLPRRRRAALEVLPVRLARWPRPAARQITKTVMVGSSNMTSNASKVQWNDLYTVRGDPTLHSQYLSMFGRMQRDRDENRTFAFADGHLPDDVHPADPRQRRPDAGRAELHPLRRRDRRHRLSPGARSSTSTCTRGSGSAATRSPSRVRQLYDSRLLREGALQLHEPAASTRSSPTAPGHGCPCGGRSSPSTAASTPRSTATSR